MLSSLKEYVGDVTRTQIAVYQTLETEFGQMSRVGGQNRVFDISGTQQGAIYALVSGAAIGLGWSQSQLVDTIYWWDRFDFGEPDYAIDIPEGVDIERWLPQIKNAIETKQIGEIAI